MEWFRQIWTKYGPVGWLMALSGSAYLTLVLSYVVLGPGFEQLFSNLTMPMQLDELLRKPWTLVTYWIVNHPFAIWMVLVDLALIFSFGTILQGLLGRARFQWMAIGYAVGTALLTFMWVNLLPTVEEKATAVLFGMHPLNAAVIMSCILLAPNMRLRIFTWEVKLLWVGLVLLAVPVLGFRAMFTVMGVAFLSGILLGAATILVWTRLIDRQVWNIGRGGMPIRSVAPKERVRVREARQNPQHKGKFTVVHSKMAPEDELNRLLDRINEVGYNGLTASEKKRLEELSGDA